MQVIPTPNYTLPRFIGRGPTVDVSPIKLRALREAAELTQFELAFLAGTTPATISRLENGHRAPNLATVFRLSSALGVDLAAIVGTQMVVRPRRGGFRA
jgi:transcriptional regulator with XRE-family HTH domain